MRSVLLLALAATALPPPAADATAPAPAAPAPGSDDEPMAAHAAGVADYTLSASLDPAAHTIHGEGTIAWTNRSTKPVNELWLHLYLNAFKSHTTVWMRETVGGFRGTHGLTDFGRCDVRRLTLREPDGGAGVDLWKGAELHRPGDDDETDVRVPLPREIAPGEAITLDVVFDDKLPSVLERTGYEGSFHFAGQWFPKIARLEDDGTWAHFPFHHLAEFYADYGTYDVTIDVPETFVIGASGPTVSSTVTGGRRVERHVQSDIHDFAWTAWDRWQTQTESVDGVAVTLLHPPGARAVAQRQLAALRFALPHFGDRYGKYPYPVLTVVHPPDRAREAGGMEYPTLITTGGPWYGPPGVAVPEIVTVHEFGHQYFYGLIATHEVDWPFLDEGLNSYAEEETLRALRGPGTAASLLGLTVSQAEVRAAFTNRVAHDEPVAQPAYAFSSGSNYGSLVYGRTSTVLETMRRVYGDAAMRQAMGRYARRYRFKHPVPGDLLKTFGEVLGPGPSATLKTALFDKGWIDLTVRILAKTTEEGTVLITRRGPLSYPVDVELTYQDGKTERRRWDGQGTTFPLHYRGRLRAAVVDPDRTILIDEDLGNNHAVVPGQSGGGAPRTLERALYWSQLLVQAVSP